MHPGCILWGICTRILDELGIRTHVEISTLRVSKKKAGYPENAERYGAIIIKMYFKQSVSKKKRATPKMSRDMVL